MYSSMQLLPSGEVALLFEREGGLTMGGGLNISLTRFNISDLRGAAGPPPPFIPHTPTQLRVSNVLGSGMVLQRAPARAHIWGLAVPGDAVTVNITGGRSPSYTATAAADGRWAVRVQLTTADNPHTIGISSARGKPAAPIVLSDVLAGEVHMCSGRESTANLREFARARIHFWHLSLTSAREAVSLTALNFPPQNRTWTSALVASSMQVTNALLLPTLCCVSSRRHRTRAPCRCLSSVLHRRPAATEAAGLQLARNQRVGHSGGRRSVEAQASRLRASSTHRSCSRRSAFR